jgi:glycosyltransferase involved in cell wall biosynthesis
MTTHVTYRPHYDDRKYGEYVSDKIYHMKLFGIPRGIPVFSNTIIGRLNSFFLPDDTTYLCNGAFELYPVYYRRPKSTIVTMMKELTFWRFNTLEKYKQNFIIKLFSVNKGVITDTFAMKSLIEKHIDTHIEVVNPFCAQPFLKNKPDLNSKKIIFIGSFESPNKGYRELLEAFRLLREKDDEWELYMVGKRGTDFVKDRMPGLHITNFVSSLKPYLSKCSIYVHPAQFEPFGITVLEAMSAGIMPIVTKSTGASEVLEGNGLQSLVVGDNSPKSLKDKIEEVHNYSIAKKTAISKKSKKIVKNSYLEKDGVEVFKKAFNRICEK